MSSFRKVLIKVGTGLIPVKSVRRRLRRRLLDRVRDERVAHTTSVVCGRYAENERVCREKLARGEKLRAAFLVCDVSMFSFESVFVQMRADPRFDCFIAIVPRVTRGEAFLRATLEKAANVLVARYGDAVRVLYDTETRKAVPLDGQADIVFTSMVYEDQSSAEYTVERLSSSALVASCLYAYAGLHSNDVTRTAFLPNVVFSWKFFLSTPAAFREWTGHNPELRRNAVVSGYMKMDRLARVEADSHGKSPEGTAWKKTVLVCPHHSIDQGENVFHLSTFLTFADFFLKLPGLYPDIKFVFRPHPLLFPRLRMRQWWGEEKTSAYERALEAWPNVEFQRGGDYFQTFVESDAMIHDCGSFLAEYFYTGKPQCFLLDDEKTMSREFLPFGRRLLDASLKAFTEKEILDFIDHVVVAGEDPQASARRKFAESEVCLYYPDASGHVVRDVLETIKGGAGRSEG